MKPPIDYLRNVVRRRPEPAPVPGPAPSVRPFTFADAATQIHHRPAAPPTPVTNPTTEGPCDHGCTCDTVIYSRCYRQRRPA